MTAAEEQFASAQRHLDAARFLIDGNHFTISVPCSYYALLNGFKALLLQQEDNGVTEARYKVRYLTSEVGRQFVRPGRLPSDTVQQFHLVQQDRHRINYRAKTVSESVARDHVERAGTMLGKMAMLI